MADVTYQFHWLSFTVKADREDAFSLYSNIFEDSFGIIQALGNGGRGFKEIYHGLLELKIYLTPVNPCAENYWHIEIPGQACENLHQKYFMALGDYLESNFKDRYSYKRLDIAFDNVGFEPIDVENAIKSNQVRCLSKRETLRSLSSPFQLKDNGSIGTYTVEFGSNQSERMITVYNKRGYTRLEFQMRGDRADVVAKKIITPQLENNWFGSAIEHLRDFVDFETAWWVQFVNGNARAFETISRPRDVSMNKLMRWMDHQISPALSVAVDVLPEESMNNLIRNGRRRRGSRYDLLLNSQNSGSDEL
jgi:DNA relaxase NicK